MCDRGLQISNECLQPWGWSIYLWCVHCLIGGTSCLLGFVIGFSCGTYTAWVLVAMLHKVLYYLLPFLYLSWYQCGCTGWFSLAGQWDKNGLGIQSLYINQPQRWSHCLGVQEKVLLSCSYWIFGCLVCIESLTIKPWLRLTWLNNRDTVPSVGILRSQTLPFVDADASIRVFRQALSLDEVGGTTSEHNLWLLIPFNSSIAPCQFSSQLVSLQC